MLRCALGVLVLLQLPIGLRAQEREVATFDGKVSEVTVYQGQALVSRTVDLLQNEGLAEIVVSNLPDFVVPGSIYAEPVGEGVEIRSVRYRVRPMAQDVRQEVRDLDAQLKELTQNIDKAERAKQLLQERKEYLSKLENFTAGTSKAELESGVLDAATLMELTGFLFSQRNTIGQEDLEVSQQLDKLRGEVELLQRQRNQISAGSSKTVREAVVFANVPAGGNRQMRLNYLVTNATWSPSYNLRKQAQEGTVTVEYNAAIEQLSGEDWNDVAMTLSTANPSLVASAPTLDSLVVKLGRDVPQQMAMPDDGSAQMSAKSELTRRQKELASNRGNNLSNGIIDADSLFGVPQPAAPAMAMGGSMGRGGYGGGGMSGYGGEDKFGINAPGGKEPLDVFSAAQLADGELNELAEQLQVLEFNSARFETRKDEPPKTLAGEGVSVSYRLSNRLSLPSRSDRQLLQISSRQLKGEFYRIATPVLTSYVYNECRLINEPGEVMLAGPSSTFVAGQFVGRGSVPTVSAGESFQVGLGIDTSLRATRTLVDKSERISGGNRLVDFTYELAIENFGDEATQVRLLDRMPTSKQADMKITLVKSDKPVSEDVAYNLGAAKDGLLRWDIEVPAGATGPKRLTLSYTMQMEYDKQLSIER